MCKDLYAMGSEYGTITISKHALMMFLNVSFAFKLFSEFMSLLCSFIPIFH